MPRLIAEVRDQDAPDQSVIVVLDTDVWTFVLQFAKHRRTPTVTSQVSRDRHSSGIIGTPARAPQFSAWKKPLCRGADQESEVDSDGQLRVRLLRNLQVSGAAFQPSFYCVGVHIPGRLCPLYAISVRSIATRREYPLSQKTHRASFPCVREAPATLRKRPQG